MPRFPCPPTETLKTVSELHSSCAPLSRSTSGTQWTTKQMFPTKDGLLEGFDDAIFRSLSIGNSGMGLSVNKDVAMKATEDPAVTRNKLFVDDSKDTARVRTETIASSKSHKSLIKPLLWRFSDYSVAPCHWFSSMSPGSLLSKIQEALRNAEVSYEVDDQDTICYECEKTVGFTQYKFSIVVSSLLSTCQEKLNSKYLIEVSRKRCGNYQPSTWSEIMDSLFAKLGSFVSSRSTTSTVALAAKEDSTRDLELSEPVDFNVVSSFIDTFSDVQTDETQVGLAELYTDLSTSLDKYANSSHPLRSNDMSCLISMLQRADPNLQRCTCVVLRSIAEAGWLKQCPLDEVAAATLQLSRMIHDFKSPFGLDMKIEAVKALDRLGGLLYKSQVRTRDEESLVSACT